MSNKVDDLKRILQQIQKNLNSPVVLHERKEGGETYWIIPHRVKVEHDLRQNLITELVLKAIDILSGAKRRWQEIALYVEKFHSLKQEQYGVAMAGRRKRGWSLRDSAKELKMSHVLVADYINLARAMSRDSKIETFQDMNAALKYLERKKES